MVVSLGLFLYSCMYRCCLRTYLMRLYFWSNPFYFNLLRSSRSSPHEHGDQTRERFGRKRGQAKMGDTRCRPLIEAKLVMLVDRDDRGMGVAMIRNGRVSTRQEQLEVEVCVPSSTGLCYGIINGRWDWMQLTADIYH